MNNIDLIQNKMGLVSENLKLISDNIANINTPNYKRKYIDIQGDDFNSVFNIQLKKLNEKHIDAAENTGNGIPHEVQSSIKTDNNGVDVDTEVMELNKNSLFSNSLISLLNGSLENERTVINSK